MDRVKLSSLLEGELLIHPVFNRVMCVVSVERIGSAIQVHLRAYTDPRKGLKDGLIIESEDLLVTPLNPQDLFNAMHEAITAPMGVVPVACEAFYDQDYYG